MTWKGRLKGQAYRDYGVQAEIRYIWRVGDDNGPLAFGRTSSMELAEAARDKALAELKAERDGGTPSMKSFDDILEMPR